MAAIATPPGDPSQPSSATVRIDDDDGDEGPSCREPHREQPYDDLLSMMLIDPETVKLPENLVATWTSKAVSYRPADVPPPLFDARMITVRPEVEKVTIQYPNTKGELLIDDQSGLAPGREKGTITLEVVGKWKDQTGFCIQIVRKAKIECKSEEESEEAVPTEPITKASGSPQRRPSVGQLPPHLPDPCGTSRLSALLKARRRKTTPPREPCEMPEPAGPAYGDWKDEMARREFKCTELEDALKEADDVLDKVGCQLRLPLLIRPTPYVPIHQFISELKRDDEQGIIGGKSRRSFRPGTMLHLAGSVRKNMEAAASAIKQKTDGNLHSLSKYDYDAMFLIAKIKADVELLSAEIFKRSRLQDELDWLSKEIRSSLARRGK